MNSCRDSYLDGRARLGTQCLELLKDLPGKERILSHVFWENLWCGADGVPRALYYDEEVK